MGGWINMRKNWLNFDKKYPFHIGKIAKMHVFSFQSYAGMVVIVVSRLLSSSGTLELASMNLN